MDNFRELVKEAFGPTVLTQERAKKFSQRARAHICTCCWLDRKAREGDADLEHCQKIPHNKIQQIQKSLHAHRSIMNFDGSHNNAMLQETGAKGGLSLL